MKHVYIDMLHVSSQATIYIPCEIMLAKKIRSLFLFGVGFGVAASTAGCAVPLDTQQVDYEKLPGSGDRMADGPGLLGEQKGGDYDGGYLIYSDNPSQASLFRSTESPKPSTAHVNGTPPQSELSDKLTGTQEQDYREFKKYQQYRRFKELPDDSVEHQRFREWQEWKKYQQWLRQEVDPN